MATGSQPAPPQNNQVPSQVPTQVPLWPTSHPVSLLESPSDNLPTYLLDLSLRLLWDLPLPLINLPNPLCECVFTNLFKLPATVEAGINLWSWVQSH